MNSYTSEIVVGSAFVAALGIAGYMAIVRKPQEKKKLMVNNGMIAPIAHSIHIYVLIRNTRSQTPI